MNPKIKIGLAAALILAAILGIFWWPASKSAESAPSTAPATKLPAAPPTKPMSVALPVVPPAVPTPTAVGAAPLGDPQAEIGTAVDDIISLLRSSEILAFYEKYTPPAEQANWPASHRTELARQDAMVKANPSGGGMMESMISGFESLKGQTPQMNTAGDEATFVFTMQPPPGMDAQPRVTPMAMVKVNGLWYLKM